MLHEEHIWIAEFKSFSIGIWAFVMISVSCSLGVACVLVEEMILTSVTHCCRYLVGGTLAVYFTSLTPYQVWILPSLFPLCVFFHLVILFRHLFFNEHHLMLGAKMPSLLPSPFFNMFPSSVTLSFGSSLFIILYFMPLLSCFLPLHPHWSSSTPSCWTNSHSAAKPAEFSLHCVCVMSLRPGWPSHRPGDARRKKTWLTKHEHTYMLWYTYVQYLLTDNSKMHRHMLTSTPNTHTHTQCLFMMTNHLLIDWAECVCVRLHVQ